MWMKEILMALIGLSCGFAVAGGIFALLIALGVVSDFADRTHTAKHIFLYEDAVAAGGIIGNLLSVYQFVLPLGNVGAGMFGIFSGIFVGGWAMALTEIVNIVPIFTRRLEMRRGLELIIVSMSVGRTIGSLMYYYYRW
ncbi:MAG: stage V sporulation protein AB [Lachnospiraceae bacterium]|jgi:stage V sporulation protein AB|nr:stage V sporulation protein AB [Lachnospiraceae bacterium]